MQKTRLTAFQQQHAQELLASGDWSQADVAKMLNMSPSWLSRLAKRWRAAGLLDQPLPMTLPTPADEDAETVSE